MSFLLSHSQLETAELQHTIFADRVFIASLAIYEDLGNQRSEIREKYLVKLILKIHFAIQFYTGVIENK